jgi:oxalate decarboxylase/phosphoglucose isomerase-like protein (cupin superfamily)
MSGGVIHPPGAGRRIVGGSLDATVKMTMDHPALTSTFEIVLGPGFDVGAHVHGTGEEIFYVIEGQLDVLAFEPTDRAVGDWHRWESATGQTFVTGGPGAFMFVPPGVPHAFSNSTDKPVKVFFQSSVPGGHENYFDELMAIMEASKGRPDADTVADLRARYDIEQITSLH